MNTQPLCAVLLMTLACSGAGCSDGLCPTVVKTAVSTQSKVSDSLRALDQAGKIYHNVPMPDEYREKFQKALEAGYKSLIDANKLLSSSIVMCNAPNVDEKIAEFNKVWSTIKSLLNLFGQDSVGLVRFRGEVGGTVFESQGVPAVLDIADPISYQEPK